MDMMHSVVNLCSINISTYTVSQVIDVKICNHINENHNSLDNQVLSL